MQGQIDSISTLVSQFPLINLLILAANTYMTLNIKLAISKIETKIAEDRMKDEKELKSWVESKIDSHAIKCFGK